MLKKRIYVLYGSQTGNAESIAKEFNENLERNGFISKCLTLNSTSADDMKQNADYITIICSTTGNGDAPENADTFWRTIKKRTLPKDLLTGLQFSVLGLGDTNYDKFCFIGKSIDKRFSELGATRFLDLHCADESTNLEEVVESWKTQCENIMKKMESDSIQLESTAKLIENIALNPNTGDHIENKDISLTNTTLSTNEELQNCEADSKILPNGVINLSEIVKYFNLSVDLSISPDNSLLPKSRRNNDNNFEIVTEGKTQPSSSSSSSSSINSSQTTTSTTSQDKQNLIKPIKGRSGSNTSEWTIENPFHASINYAKWLTQPPNNLSSPLCPTKTSEEVWEHTRDVILVDINIHLSGIQYQPGDSIAISVPNPEKLVNFVIERLQSSTTLTTTTLTTNDDNKITPLFQKDTIIRKTDGEELSLFELLSYRVDLVSIPRKATVLALSECCKDENEANALRWLCTKGEIGKNLWKYFFEDQNVGVGELLALYPSCTPTLQTLISILSPLPPRAYSIATSPLLHPCSVEVAMSLVRYCCVSGGYQSHQSSSTSPTSTSQLKVIKRSGLCTSYLHNLLKKWLYPSTHSNDPTPSPIRIIHKPSATFRLPGNVASPLVLIGPGTGVAPFIGFLSHRSAIEKERRVSGEDTCTGMWRGGYELAGTCDLPCEGNRIDEFIQHVQPGDIHLYFGCRTEDDWIFRESMEMRLDEGTLTVLETALSRVGPEKIYVTHKLKSRGKELTDLILESNAYVYICGDGCHMAKDVTNTLMQIIEENSNLTSSEIQKLFESMKQRRRFLLDIWS